MKKRQDLPLLAKLNFKIDIKRLTEEFYAYGYNDWALYDGLKFKSETQQGTLGFVARRVLLEHFLNDSEISNANAETLVEGGEAYKMLCLTDYNYDKVQKTDYSSVTSELQKDTNIQQVSKKLEKISNPNHRLYIPEADEKNYDIRNAFCKGYINEICNIIEEQVGHITRTRLAVLMPGEQIKPHMDINTDKAIRIHIPILTNEDCILGVKGKHASHEEHMAADGSVWFLNQGYTHWVKNNGSTPRVHLVSSVIGQGSIDDAFEKWNDVNYE